MMVADYFPRSGDFNIIPNLVIEKDKYNFFVWEFDNDGSR